MWRHYFGGTDAVIMVVDSTDRERRGRQMLAASLRLWCRLLTRVTSALHRRVQLARQELHRALDTDVLQGAHLLLLANKQDLRDAMGPGQLSTELALTDIRGRQWRIQGSSAVTGEGLKEGLDWLAQVSGRRPAPSPLPRARANALAPGQCQRPPSDRTRVAVMARSSWERRVRTGQHLRTSRWTRATAIRPDCRSTSQPHCGAHLTCKSPGSRL